MHGIITFHLLTIKMFLNVEINQIEKKFSLFKK
jgi:hypothetical protein